MLNNNDKNLIKLATKLIEDRFVEGCENHTVGCAVLTKCGKIYYGVNMYMDGMNCVCAEQNAIGSALTDGVKEFETIVAVGKTDIVNILAPCGQCRQFLNKYAPNVKVIVNNNEKLTIDKLLPFAYSYHHKH